MLTALRSKLSFANVTSCLALFIALGGTGYAAMKLPRNSVGSTQIRAQVGRLVRAAPERGDVAARSRTARSARPISRRRPAHPCAGRPARPARQARLA